MFEKPEIGNNPFKPIEESRPNKKADSVQELMRILIMYFEGTTKDYVSYPEINRNMKISRIYLDLVINEAIDAGLITQTSGTKSVYLTTDGKKYAIKHSLIKI